MVLFGKDLKAGVILRIDHNPWLVQKTEVTMSGMESSIIKTKLKNLLTGHKTETIYFAEAKFDEIIPDRREARLFSIHGDMYTFMDMTNYTKYEVDRENIEGVLPYIEEGMADICEAVFFEGKLVTIELPTRVFRRVSYVDPSLGEGTHKRAQLMNGTHIMVPNYVKEDDFADIDTRDGNFANTL